MTQSNAASPPDLSASIRCRAQNQVRSESGAAIFPPRDDTVPDSGPTGTLACMWALVRMLLTLVLRPFTRHRTGDDGLSEPGFLAPWNSLSGVISRDRATLSRLGVTPEQIADALELLLERKNVLNAKSYLAWKRKGGHRFQGEYPRVTYPWPASMPRFTVSVWQTYDIQACPFVSCPSGGERGSCDVEIRAHDGRKIRFGDLSIHLIREHEFFEGDVAYRVDPARCVRVLGLEPGVSYKPVWDTVPIWRRWMEGGPLEDSPDCQNTTELRELVEAAEECVEPIPGARLYFRGDECAGVYDGDGGEFEITVRGHRIRDAFCGPETRRFTMATQREVALDRGPDWGAIVI